MILDKQTGIIDQARFVASPNFDKREQHSEPEVIIIHCISLPPGEYGSDAVCDFFSNKLNPDNHAYFEQIKHLKVSSHFFIRRCGELIQFVSTNERAWHAGESSCLGKPKVNDFSIGIELEGFDEDPQGYTDAQYQTLNELTLVLQRNYQKIGDHLFAHSDIAPLRKTDPGQYFNWQKILC